MLPIKNEYTYFLTACEYLNFSHASEALNIQQAAVSKAIKKLELDYGQALFIRKARKLKITEFGQLLRSQLIKHENLWSKEFYELLEQHDAISGRLNCGVNETVAINSLNHVLARLHEIDTSLDIEVNFNTSSNVVKGIIAGDYDFGFAINPVKHQDLVIKKLEREYTALWSTSKKPDNIFFYHPDTIHAAKYFKKYQHCKKVPVQSYELMAAMAQTSSGVFLLPNPIASKVKGLKQLDKVVVHFELCLVYRYDRPKTKAFSSVLADICAHYQA
jgi:DNA-binding transcriptional LysR family regulator